ncbi:MAG TPA: RHS repeat-associated core domain-containing protein, partial [Bryobacteraceae bacterium]|nr:RHS repeat-associated core domain-containing protein [Bryobacteraceae bacterium]
GGFAQMSFGNGLGQVFSYNPRLQPSEFKYTQSGQSNYLLDLQTFWGMNATQNQSNNGNLQSVLEGTNNGPNLSIMINTYTGYNYDGVNRLIAANDNNWSRSFGYDPYGNMWVTGATGITPSSLTPTGSNGYNANNQLTVNAGYDASGNQTTFGVNTMAYDAESRQIGVSNTNPGMQAAYFYDGDGKRVMRSINGASTTYVYDAAGELAAEYDSAPPAVPPCTTCYLSWDHLGSTRLVTDQSDNVVSRHDYLPFGEEIAAGVGGRTSVWGASDLVTQKFTSKERDTEIGLDYFGARYYGSVLGRFASADWNALPQPVPFADYRSPQTLNLYAYVANNPLSAIDANGHNWWDKLKNFWGDAACWCEGDEAKQQAATNRAAREQAAANHYKPKTESDKNDLTALVESTIAYNVAGAIADAATETSFNSLDPLVGDLASEIEGAYPGSVQGVNVPILRSDGSIATDADILTNNAIIQVKSGGGKGLSDQVARTETATGMVTIGYGPDLKGSVVKEMQSKGQLVTKDKQVLINVVKPDAK